MLPLCTNVTEGWSLSIAWVDLVLACVLGGGAVGGLEDGVAGVVVDVGAGGDADAADAGGEGVGDVVAVEVHGGDDGVLGGAGEDLLEEGVGDDVLDDDGRCRSWGF
jgi:hypothetical protein